MLCPWTFYKIFNDDYDTDKQMKQTTTKYFSSTGWLHKKTLPINDPLGRYHSRKRGAFWDMVIFWQGLENDVKKNIKALTGTVTVWNFLMVTSAFYFSNWSLGSKIRNAIESAFGSGYVDIKQTSIKTVKRIISSTEGPNIK